MFTKLLNINKLPSITNLAARGNHFPIGHSVFIVYFGVHKF